jgi:hypothetical protein
MRSKNKINKKDKLKSFNFCALFYNLIKKKNRLLQGAENLQLKKVIKSKFGGGTKEFIFEEQEFYENIENEDVFLNTQEKQSIIYEFLNQIVCTTDIEEIVFDSKKVPNGRKLSKFFELVILNSQE